MNVAVILFQKNYNSLKESNFLFDENIIYWNIQTVCECKDIDRVYIITKSEKVKKIFLILKNEKKYDKLFCISDFHSICATDICPEHVMLEFASQYIFDNIVFLQIANFFVSSKDLHFAFSLLSNNVDSVLSVERLKRSIWKVDKDSNALQLNSNLAYLLCEEKMGGEWIENGVLYITSRKLLLSNKCRVSGQVKAIQLENDLSEIDDLAAIQNIERRLEYKYANLKQVKMFITDCDGCLTDGGMYYTENGDEIKKFNVKDGMGFKLLHDAGILTGIITGESRKLNSVRAKKLQLDIFEMGVVEKLPALEKVCQQYGISLQEVAYVGDDINDISILEKVGFPCCVYDAVDEVKCRCSYIAQKCGGEGAIREIIELILKNR